MYWIEKDDNSNFYDVKTKINNVIHNIGMVEKPYHFDNIYMATDWNNGTLSQNGSFIFRDFDVAKNKIIEHWEYEMEVLKNV